MKKASMLSVLVALSISVSPQQLMADSWFGKTYESSKISKKEIKRKRLIEIRSAFENALAKNKFFLAKSLIDQNRNDIFGQGDQIHYTLLPGGGGTQRLPRLVGMGNAMRLILTGDMIGADEALQIGLVDQVVPHDELRQATLDLANKIASKSPLTARVAKEAMRASERMSIEEGILYERDLFCLCFSTEDKAEGVSAFLEKRRAEWKGR